MSTPAEPNPLPRWQLWRRWFRRVPVLQSDASGIARQQDHDLVMSLSTRRIPSWSQLTALPTILNSRERWWATLWIFLAVISLVTIGVHEVVGRIGTIPQAGGTLTEAIVGTPQFINPVLARPGTADAQLAALSFRGLLRVDADQQIIPDVARSYTVSADGKTYTLTLRSGVKWSDGTTLTAQDVVYTYQTMADTQFKSPWAGNVANVKVAAGGDNVVTLTFAAASRSNLTTLTLGLIPSHLWADQTGQTFSLAELNTKPIGNGPMKFSSLAKDHSGQIKSMTFVRNKLYTGQQTYLDKLVFKFYPDMVSAVQAITSGSVDSLADVPIDSVPDVQKHSTITDIPLAQLVGVFFNQRQSTLLKSADIRKALVMALDRQDIVDHALQEHAVANDSPLVPGMIGYNPNLKSVANHLDDARTLLDKAGWKTGTDGIRVKAKQTLAFTLTTVDESNYRSVANALAARWLTLGVKVNVRLVDSSQIERDVVRPRSYDALLFGQRFSVDGDPYAFWDSGQQRDPGFGLAIFYDKNVDTDVEDAHTTTKPDQLAKNLADFQNLIIDQVPAIMLYQSVSSYAHPKQLRGFNDQHLVSSANRFDDVSNWYLRTRLSWTAKEK